MIIWSMKYEMNDNFENFNFWFWRWNKKKEDMEVTENPKLFKK